MKYKWKNYVAKVHGKWTCFHKDKRSNNTSKPDEKQCSTNTTGLVKHKTSGVMVDFNIRRFLYLSGLRQLGFDPEIFFSILVYT